jgi:hypothetical protein
MVTQAIISTQTLRSSKKSLDNYDDDRYSTEVIELQDYVKAIKQNCDKMLNQRRN